MQEILIKRNIQECLVRDTSDIVMSLLKKYNTIKVERMNDTTNKIIYYNKSKGNEK